MQTYSFVKSPLAPAGQINFALSNDEFMIDDGANNTIIVSTITQAGELRSHPYLVDETAASSGGVSGFTGQLGTFNSRLGNIILGYTGA